MKENENVENEVQSLHLLQKGNHYRNKMSLKTIAHNMPWGRAWQIPSKFQRKWVPLIKGDKEWKA